MGDNYIGGYRKIGQYRWEARINPLDAKKTKNALGNCATLTLTKTWGNRRGRRTT